MYKNERMLYLSLHPCNQIHKKFSIYKKKFTTLNKIKNKTFFCVINLHIYHFAPIVVYLARSIDYLFELVLQLISH